MTLTTCSTIRCLPSAAPRATLASIAAAILAESSLSFLGFGIQSPTPEWGLMMNEGASYIVNGQWWVTFFPGLAILSLIFACFLVDQGVKAVQSGA